MASMAPLSSLRATPCERRQVRRCSLRALTCWESSRISRDLGHSGVAAEARGLQARVAGQRTDLARDGAKRLRGLHALAHVAGQVCAAVADVLGRLDNHAQRAAGHVDLSLLPRLIELDACAGTIGIGIAARGVGTLVPA